jgi:hypothetical protein
MPMGHWEGASTLKADFFPGPPNFSEQPYGGALTLICASGESPFTGPDPGLGSDP